MGHSHGATPQQARHEAFMLMCERLRLSLALALVLAWAGPAAAQTYVTHAQDDTAPFITDGIADVAITPTNGNTVCVMFAVPATSRTVTSVADNGSTTYSLVATNQSASREGWMYCGIVAGSPTSIAITISSAVGAGGYAGAIEFSGTHTSDSIGNNVSYFDNTGTMHNPGSLTISGSAAVALAFVYGSNGSYTPDDYTSRYNATINTVDQAVVAHKSITANDEFNLTTGGNEETVILVAEILPAAGGATCTAMLLGVGPCEE